MTDISQLAAAVSGGSCESYKDVLNRLDAVGAALDARDGLCWFNRLYRAMTESCVQTRESRRVQDPVFLEGLDCSFADLYFGAIRAHLADGSEAASMDTLVRCTR